MVNKKSLFTFIFRLKHKFYFIKSNYWYALFMKKAGAGLMIIKPVLITPDCIEMGNHVFVRNGGRIEGINRYLSKTYRPIIQIGDNVSIEQNIHLTCAQSVHIDKNTAIAANVTITDINHPYEQSDIPVEQQELEIHSVYIGEDCKIYNNAVILPGTSIGKHCVIGANSVVSGKFPEYSIIAGIPAKIIKRYSEEKKSWLRYGEE